ncbi:hypothetical protein LZ32DRAFT_689186 [Colletotrichum eremochloae]|nr:hypothetical protein LZ32DRAFT_689186 [Colletotrichum eremochloae]
MCKLETTDYICTHRHVDRIPCDEVEFPYGDWEDCGNVAKTESTKNYCCDYDCIYRKWRKRWVCHKCHGPNQKTPRCAIKRCGHIVCDKCKPLTGPKKDKATKIKYNALKHIKWSKMPKPTQPLPPVPVYDSSVGDWV